MTGARRNTPTLSTCGLLAAGAAFVTFRIVFSSAPIFAVERHLCQGSAGSADHGLFVWLMCGALWLAAFELAVVSLAQGLLVRNGSTVFKGVIALGIAFLNFANLPSSRPPSDPFSVYTLRSINTAEVTYLSASGGSYGGISDLVRHDLIDPRLDQSSTLNNYEFEVVLRPEGYVATASPTEPYSPAERCWEYFSQEDAVVRYSKDPDKAPPGLVGKPLAR